MFYTWREPFQWQLEITSGHVSIGPPRKRHGKDEQVGACKQTKLATVACSEVTPCMATYDDIDSWQRDGLTTHAPKALHMLTSTIFIISVAIQTCPYKAVVCNRFRNMGNWPALHRYAAGNPHAQNPVQNESAMHRYLQLSAEPVAGFQSTSISMRSSGKEASAPPRYAPLPAAWGASPLQEPFFQPTT
jgi:hypothetical protein